MIVRVRWGDGQSPEALCRFARSAGGADAGIFVGGDPFDHPAVRISGTGPITAERSGANGWNEIEACLPNVWLLKLQEKSLII